jgi:hypothetical protein
VHSEVTGVIMEASQRLAEPIKVRRVEAVVAEPAAHKTVTTPSR